MRIEGLSPERQAALEACKTPEDLFAFARESGVNLSDDQLDEIGGGWGGDCDHDYEIMGVKGGISTLRCRKCGYEYRAPFMTPPM